MKRRKSNQDKRRKEEKRLEKLNSEDFSFESKWFILFCTVMVFLMFYILTVYITNKNNPKTDNESTTEETSSTGEILLGRSLSINDREYYVLFYDSSDEEVASTCQEVFSNYRAGNGDDSIYYVDMKSGFNKSHATDGEANRTPEKAEDLLIHGPTLIKVSQNRVVDYIEGLESIQEYLV